MNTKNPQLTAAEGGVYVADTAAHASATATENTRQFQAIQIVETAILAAIAGNISGISGIVGVSLLPGFVLYGRFTTFTLTSGKVIAYYA